MGFNSGFKGLNAELNFTCYLLALLGAHHILHVSRIRIKQYEYITNKNSILYFSDRASSYNSGKWPNWRTVSSVCLFESSTCFEQLCTRLQEDNCINPLHVQLNPICHLLALLGAHHIFHVSRIRVNTTSGMITLKHRVIIPDVVLCISWWKKHW